MNIYVGNLTREVTQDDLHTAFGAFGQVTSASLIKDKFSGESRGFAFVEMPVKTEAEKAMNEIKEIKGRPVTINEARPKESNFRGGGRSGGYGGRGHGGRDGGWR